MFFVSGFGKTVDNVFQGYRICQTTIGTGEWNFSLKYRQITGGY